VMFFPGAETLQDFWFDLRPQRFSLSDIPAGGEAMAPDSRPATSADR
jgi:acyl transferase domain-containing protein